MEGKKVKKDVALVLSKRFLLLVWLFFWVLPMLAQLVQLPAWYRSSVRLNIRSYPNTYSSVVTTVNPGTRLKVVAFTTDNWAKIDYSGRTVYAYGRYLEYVGSVERPVAKPVQTSSHSNRSSSSSDWSWLWTVILSMAGILILRKVLVFVLGFFSVLIYKLYRLLSFPFYVLNALQRHLSKPWRIFFKQNGGNDRENEEYRTFFEYAKIPFYIILTPLRFVNAFYYNIIVHCLFEGFYYLCEVIVPISSKEGADSLGEWILWLPWRIVKYPIYHGSLTLVESGIWTIIDTFVPALTLYHGTDFNASSYITSSPNRNCIAGWGVGVWNVGGGNFAGNGIYFAPSQSTALHYSSGSLIVARVSLGRVLDLGMAPWRIYNQCGHPNAIGATDWGLKNGYVTGEWWRGDSKWWEYCMYDWQNRYNYSFRIRPLYVLNLSDEAIQRIPGGMTHWLFRTMVIKDILTYFEKSFS